MGFIDTLPVDSQKKDLKKEVPGSPEREKNLVDVKIPAFLETFQIDKKNVAIALFKLCKKYTPEFQLDENEFNLELIQKLTEKTKGLLAQINQTKNPISPEDKATDLQYIYYLRTCGMSEPGCQSDFIELTNTIAGKNITAPENEVKKHKINTVNTDTYNPFDKPPTSVSGINSNEPEPEPTPDATSSKIVNPVLPLLAAAPEKTTETPELNDNKKAVLRGFKDANDQKAQIKIYKKAINAIKKKFGSDILTKAFRIEENISKKELDAKFNNLPQFLAFAVSQKYVEMFKGSSQELIEQKKKDITSYITTNKPEKINIKTLGEYTDLLYEMVQAEQELYKVGKVIFDTIKQLEVSFKVEYKLKFPDGYGITRNYNLPPQSRKNELQNVLKSFKTEQKKLNLLLLTEYNKQAYSQGFVDFSDKSNSVKEFTSLGKAIFGFINVGFTLPKEFNDLNAGDLVKWDQLIVEALATKHKDYFNNPRVKLVLLERIKHENKESGNNTKISELIIQLDKFIQDQINNPTQTTKSSDTNRQKSPSQQSPIQNSLPALPPAENLQVNAPIDIIPQNVEKPLDPPGVMVKFKTADEIQAESEEKAKKDQLAIKQGFVDFAQKETLFYEMIRDLDLINKTLGTKGRFEKSFDKTFKVHIQPFTVLLTLALEKKYPDLFKSNENKNVIIQSINTFKGNPEKKEVIKYFDKWLFGQQNLTNNNRNKQAVDSGFNSHEHKTEAVKNYSDICKLISNKFGVNSPNTIKFKEIKNDNIKDPKMVIKYALFKKYPLGTDMQNIKNALFQFVDGFKSEDLTVENLPITIENIKKRFNLDQGMPKLNLTQK